MTFSEFKNAVAIARAAAVKEAYDSASFIKSRGTFIATLDAQGQCSPAPEAEAHEWDGTKRELDKLVERVQREYPNVTEVYVAGGYDGFETFADQLAGEPYDPWVSSWCVTYWTK